MWLLLARRSGPTLSRMPQSSRCRSQCQQVRFRPRASLRARSASAGIELLRQADCLSPRIRCRQHWIQKRPVDRLCRRVPTSQPAGEAERVVLAPRILVTTRLHLEEGSRDGPGRIPQSVRLCAGDTSIHTTYRQLIVSSSGSRLDCCDRHPKPVPTSAVHCPKTATHNPQQCSSVDASPRTRLICGCQV
jgi:hypothetical protein